MNRVPSIKNLPRKLTLAKEFLKCRNTLFYQKLKKKIGLDAFRTVYVLLQRENPPFPPETNYMLLPWIRRVSPLIFNDNLNNALLFHSKSDKESGVTMAVHFVDNLLWDDGTSFKPAHQSVQQILAAEPDRHIRKTIRKLNRIMSDKDFVPSEWTDKEFRMAERKYAESE